MGATLARGGQGGLFAEVTRSELEEGPQRPRKSWGVGSWQLAPPGQRPDLGAELALRLQRNCKEAPLGRGLAWGTLLPCSQGLRPGGRARARLEEMGPSPWPAASPGTANIPSAGDETQPRVAGGGGLGLHKQPWLVKQIKAACPSPGHFLQGPEPPSSWEGASRTRLGVPVCLGAAR